MFPDVAAEKTQQTLIAGIEKFDTASLKHTETQEKNPLPDKDGRVTRQLDFLINTLIQYVTILLIIFINCLTKYIKFLYIK